MRRSVLIETPHLGEKTGSKRSSMILEQFGALDDDPRAAGSEPAEKQKDQHISAFLRSNSNEVSPTNSYEGYDSNGGTNGTGNGGSPMRTATNGDSPERSRLSAAGSRPPRPSFMSTGMHNTTSSSNSPNGHTVTRADLRQSAEKILYTFLLQGSEREIILPQSILNDIVTSIEDDHRDDPEVFDAAKDYVFQAMERDAFPGFLRSKALGNLVPPSIFARGILGLIALFGGFWAAFILIFLNSPKHIRSWVRSVFSLPLPLYAVECGNYGADVLSLLQLILPFTIGIYALASQQYKLDPILAMIGFSEYTFMNFARIKDPYVRSLLIRRGAMNLAITILVGAALVVLFIFVPGKRL